MSELIQNPNEIQLNEQQEIQQIIGDPPSWMLRWGLTLVAAVVIGLLCLAWYVEYPDTIDAKIILATEVPPSRIIAENSGKLEQIFVKDGELVNVGDNLYSFENTAKAADVATLEAFLEEVLEEGLESELQLPSGLSLGTLQEEWSAFTESYRIYLSNLENDNTDAQIRYKIRQVREIEKLNGSLSNQKAMAENELSISQIELERFEGLLDEGAISELERDNKRGSHSKIQREFERLQSEIYNNNIQIAKLRGEISDLREGNSDEGNAQAVKAQEDFERLKSKIASWKDSFIETSSVSGKIAFTRRLNEGEFVKSGEELFTIVPAPKEGGKIIGKANLPLEGIGKVKVGHEVLIYIAAFPYLEHGFLKGKVEHISPIPKDDSYLVDISIPNELKTTRDFTIPFQQEMVGRAEIITDKRPYLQRILDKLISTFE